MSAATPPPEGTLRTNLIWVGLMALTVLSWVLAKIEPARSGASTAVTVAVVVIAGIKGAGIISEFMEVRLSPRHLRIITGLWIVAVTIVIIAAYVD